MLSSVPRELDLGEFINETVVDKVGSTYFKLCGFICRDPFILDYSVYIKKSKKDGSRNEKQNYLLFN